MKDRETGQRSVRRLVVCLLFAAGFAGLSGGCAHSSQRTLNSFWSSVTPRQWSPRPAAESAEPKVSANVPEDPPTPPDQPPPSGSAVAELTRSWNPFAPRERLQPQKPTTQSVQTESVPPPSETSSPQLQAAVERFAPPSLQRLRTALTLGFDTKSETKSPSTAGQDQTRLRVENLLSRSHELAEAGELSQAKHLAQLARQLSEDSDLQFAPDVERPVDVIAFLDQLEPSGEVDSPKLRPAAFSDNNAPGTVLNASTDVKPLQSFPVERATVQVNRSSESPEDFAGEPVQIPGDSEPNPALPGSESGVELRPRMESAGREMIDLTGVAAVRKRFQTSSQNVPPPSLAANGPTGLSQPPADKLAREPAVSLSWTWPSLSERSTVASPSRQPPWTILAAAAGLAILVGAGWTIAAHLRRSRR